MANNEQAANVLQLIPQAEPQFNKLATVNKNVRFIEESRYAIQMLQANTFLMDVATSNPDSLMIAINNVAATGLSLNPVHARAYLVPRKVSGRMKVCLVPSYKGFVYLATEGGAIRFVKAEIVRKDDELVIQGVDLPPIHKRNPFSQEPIVGVYCVAKTVEGDYITEVMSIEEVNAVRDRSDSWKAHLEKGVTTPWKTDFNEMAKKTVVRRGWKSWPMSAGVRERLEAAMEIDSEVDPIDVTPNQEPPKENDGQREESFKEWREMLKYLDRTEEQFIAHLNTSLNRKIEKFEQLTDHEISTSTVMLSSWVEAKQKKERKNENAS